MPRKAVDGAVRLQSLNMKTTQDLRDKLEAAAAASGRALTYEVETRINRTFDFDYLMGDTETALVLRTIGNAIRRFEVKSGKQWSEDASTQEVAFDAVLSIVKALMGPMRGNAPEHKGEIIPADLKDPEEMSGLKVISIDTTIAELQKNKRDIEQRTIALRKPIRK